MREIIDCVVLMTPGHEDWIRNWVDSHCGQLGRVRLHTQDATGLATGGSSDIQWLARAQPALRRFDGCVLPVAPASLSWARTMLANAKDGLCIPVVALALDIKAPAILDLLALGVADFVRAPVCPDELQARLAYRHRLVRPAEARPASPLVAAVSPVHAGTPEARLSRHVGTKIQEPLRAYGGPAGAKRVALRQPPAMPLAGEGQTFAMGSVDEPFRQAKARLVDDFESAYLRHALSRHSGNVAQAARAASKHRRAFWALMRKHRIDAAPYRNNAP